MYVVQNDLWSKGKKHKDQNTDTIQFTNYNYELACVQVVVVLNIVS